MMVRTISSTVALCCLVTCASDDGETADASPSSSTTMTAEPSSSGPTVASPATSSVGPSSSTPSSVDATSSTTATSTSPTVTTSTGLVDTFEEPPETADTGETHGRVSSSDTLDTASTSAETLGPSSDGETELEPVKVYIAGDSTVATYRDTASTTDQAGWGQMLHEYLDSRATVENRAVGGTTSRSYIDFGHFAKIEADIAAGDTLLVQFGTNDGNKNATYQHDGQTIPYFLEPGTDYKTYLAKYIELASAKGAHLIFVTPPPRNSAYCTGGNGTGGHAQAMRELGSERGIPVADLNMRSVEYLKAICPAPTPEDFFLLRGDGSVDGTHFQENGARHLAAMVADEVAAMSVSLSRYFVSRP